MPWKNGGGETREITVSPAGGTLETLDWRVSLATVSEDGPFSVFKGVQRTLCVIRGAGIQLQAGDRSPVDLYGSSEPYSFDGEVVTSARLLNGPIEDLNVMSRRDRFRHSVRRMVLNGTSALDTKAQSLIIYCQGGELSCTAGAESANIQTDDSAMFSQPAQSIRLVTTQTTQIIVIEFFPE
jgi:environmental stress-induced protein Ves